MTEHDQKQERIKHMLKATNLRCESLRNPIGLYTTNPRFSWIIETDIQNAMQETYRIEVRDTGNNIVWDSGDVQCDQSVFACYKGRPLDFTSEYFWRVKVTVNGEESDWSGVASFETALPKWTAGFICGDDEPDSSECKIMRRVFKIEKPVESARVYATARGLYELYIGGEKVSDTCFNPGFSAYDRRLLYQTYNVTDLLAIGENELLAMLAAGWYKGDFAFKDGRNLYGDKMAFSARIEILYQDGSREVLETDDCWLYTESPVVYSEIYHGEIYDARMEGQGEWKQALIYDCAGNVSIEPFDGVPVRRQEILKPITLFKTPKGERVLDFGQNMAGRVRFAVNGNAGDVVKLRHTEVLDKEGNFYTEHLAPAKCTDTYICKGGGTEIYEPHFTYHGFRYVCIDEYPGEIDPNDFEAVVIHSDIEKTGEFKCSDQLINQLQSNIIWGMRSNFFDIPTDCPQRAERTGWTGDAQIFVSTACYLYNVLPFYRKWMRDLALDQLPNGGVPRVIPDVLKFAPISVLFGNVRHSPCGWGDAAVIIPWELYRAFGDKRLLEDQYDSMKGWISYIHSQANGNIWDTGVHFGDWVALDAKEGSNVGSTPLDLCATAFYAYSTELLSKTAEILGMAEDAEKYRLLHADIKKAYADEFFTNNGRLAANTQTAYILTLMFGLAPEEFLPRVINSLVKLIEENGGHLTTGFLGTPYICHALSQNGRLKEAYELLQKEDYPSWLFQVKLGATTIWERLNSILADGTINPAEMNSFNHYAYGSVGAWLYKAVAGIIPLEAGYKRIRIAPQIGGNLSFAEGKLQTPYGETISRWEIHDGCVEIYAKIPPNTTAEIMLPNGESHQAGSGEYRYSVPAEQHIEDK